MLILGVDHLEMVYVRPSVDVFVDGGLLIFCKSGVWRQPSDDERPQTINANFDALGHVCVLHRSNNQHFVDLILDVGFKNSERDSMPLMEHEPSQRYYCERGRQPIRGTSVTRSKLKLRLVLTDEEQTKDSQRNHDISAS